MNNEIKEISKANGAGPHVHGDGAKEPPPPTKRVAFYDLNPEERSVLAAYNANAGAAKIRVYNLQVALEQARAEVATAEQSFNGALTLIAQSRGIQNGEISQDLGRITAKGNQ